MTRPEDYGPSRFGRPGQMSAGPERSAGMDLKQARPAWAAPRVRRCVNVAATLGVLAVLVGVQGAPYASIGPGPAPDLSAAVARAQDSTHTVDPTLGRQAGSGRMLATTIDAAQLSWFGTARCALSATCSMLPVDTEDPAVAASGMDAMAQSQRSAAAAARALVRAGTRGSVSSGVTFPSAQLRADLGEIAGPSAGLMLTVTFVDAMTPGDLTGGRVVAGTGTINSAGMVGPIAGAKYKVAGAYAAGARVFFAPAAEMAEARGAAPADMTVLEVASAEDAVAWLCSHGGQSTACLSAAR